MFVFSFIFWLTYLFSMTHVILEYVKALLSRKAAFIILIPFKGYRGIFFFFFSLPREASGKSVLDPNS